MSEDLQTEQARQQMRDLSKGQYIETAGPLLHYTKNRLTASKLVQTSALDVMLRKQADSGGPDRLNMC